METRGSGQRSPRNAGAMHRTCRGQASRRDEGERGWSVTRAPAARLWPTGILDREGPLRPGLFPSGLRLITDPIRSGRSPVGAAPLDERKSARCLRGRRRRARSVPSPILVVRGGEAGGKDGEGLGPQELGPRRSDPPRRRPQPAAAEHVRDGRGGHGDPGLEQLALDPQVAPSGVLPGHPKDQLAYLGMDGGTPRPPTPVPPFPAQELPAPPGEGVGGDREGGPLLPGEEPAGHGEQGPVGRAVPRSPPPPAQDPQLMTKHGDLQVPVIDPYPDEQTENSAQDPMQKEREHGRSLTDSPVSQQRRTSMARSSLFTPQSR
jgi:hypothetical protein